MTPSQQYFVQIKGMHKDFNQELPANQYAYDIRNMRLTSLDEENLFALINEKGTKKIIFRDAVSKELSPYTNGIAGKCLGACSIDNKIVLFVHNPNENLPDSIYKIYKDTETEDTYCIHKLIQGNLNFQEDHPIDCITFFETETVQKVYWIDGINQLRYINIEDRNKFYNGDNPITYNGTDFKKNQVISSIPALYEAGGNSLVKLEVKKNTNGGYFKPGVIQYVITFSLKNGAESNIVAISPLYYITDSNTKGLSPENTSTNSFSLHISNLYASEDESGFEYVNIYSIHRTSINAVAECKLDQQLKIEGDTLDCTDTGLTGSLVNETDLLALYQTPFTAKTFTEKTNTLILGNVSFLKDNKFNEINSLDHMWRHTAYFNSRGFVTDYESTDTHKYKEIGINETKKNDHVYPYNISLDKSSFDVTTFKYMEYYRLGIQVMNAYGTWSNPIWIGDYRNFKHPINKHFYNNDNPTYLPYFKAVVNRAGIKALTDKQAIAIRPVVVFPSFQDRICKAQGVLNPTVYNVANRESGNVYAQSSWCFRPNAPLDVATCEHHYLTGSLGEYLDFYRKLDQYPVINFTKDDNSLMGLIHPDRFKTPTTERYPSGKRELPGWCEFRHNYPLIGNVITSSATGRHNFFTDNDKIVSNMEEDLPQPYFKNSAGYKGTEVQTLEGCMPNVFKYDGIREFLYDDDEHSQDAEDSARRWFFVDNSLVTLNSPELEFEDDSYFINMKDYSLRIVGAIPITGNINALDIITEGTEDINLHRKDIYNLTVECQSRNAWRSIASHPLIQNKYGGDYPPFSLTNIYLWQCKEDLSFDNPNVTLKMLRKYMSSLKFSNNSVFLNSEKIWKDHDVEKGSEIFFINENQNVTIPLQCEEGLLNYKSNIEDVFLINSKVPYGTVGNTIDYSTEEEIYTSNPVGPMYRIYNPANRSLQLTYKSTNHSVIKLKNKEYEGHYGQHPLPTLQQIVDNIEVPATPTPIPSIFTLNKRRKYFWDSEGVLTRYPFEEAISATSLDNGEWKIFTNDAEMRDKCHGLFCGYLWLGEIYDPVKASSNYNDKRFGGNDENALKNNQWIIAGETQPLTGSSITLRWLEGDTYYQRYDCMKTYPFTDRDINQNVEILSFMCETHINLDGRYDNRRGMSDNTTARPENFNMMNPAYSQQNTFAASRIVDGQEDVWKNQIILSRTKYSAEFSDSWTKLNMANALDLNGTKGEISKLITYHDSVYAFQEHALSQIYYNEKEQITTESGLAVQLANSNKLDGYKVLFDQIGCSNKWSVCVTTKAVYFIDDNNKSIYMWGGGQEAPLNITDKGNFNAWIRKVLKENKPWLFDNFVSYFNSSTSDVYFVNKDCCISFNEILNEFSSFYSYENTPYLQNVDKEYFMFRNDNDYVTMWQQHGGEYNSFFGELKPFSITVLANDKGIYDKIFNTVDFRSNTWKKVDERWENLYHTDFRKIRAWNEYQRGVNELNLFSGKLGDIKKKYRLWHANIPRNNLTNNPVTMRDRIRNPWAYIQLSSETDMLSTNKTVLNDIMVNSIIV